MLIKEPSFSDSLKARIAWKEENKLSSLGELIKSPSSPQYEDGWESAKYKSKSIIDSGFNPNSSLIILTSLALCLPKIAPSYFILFFKCY